MRRILGIFSPGRILLVAALAVVVFLCVSAGSNLLQHYRLSADEARMRDEVNHLAQQQDELQQIRDYLRSDDYVEFMARRVFGLVKPGEKLVIVDAPPPPQLPDEPALKEWWQRLFER